MTITENIADMIDTVLTDAEVKAIARTRGFPAGSGASRSAVKNLFLSTIGIENALEGLTREELISLHMLAYLEEPPDISFFERVYHQPDFSFNNVYMLTYAQRFREVLKQVRERLVRRGILIMSSGAMFGGLRIEKWIFELHPALIERLPPVVQTVRLPDPPTAAEVNNQAVAKLLLGLSGANAGGPQTRDQRLRLKLEDGTLTFGGNPLYEGSLFEWLSNAWIQSVGGKLVSSTLCETPVVALIQTIAHLQPEEWFLPRQIAPNLAIRSFGFEIPEVDMICEEGWKWGLLARRETNKQVYYSPRLIYNPYGIKIPLPAPDLSAIIQTKKEQSWVEFEKLPAALLVVLNLTCRLELRGTRLFFSQDEMNLATYFPHIQKDPLVLQFLNHMPDLKSLYERVSSNYGKNILHQNLLVARVSDLSLMVQIERSFRPGSDYVKLDKEWVAFSRGVLPEVEKLVKKHDCVVKRVKA